MDASLKPRLYDYLCSQGLNPNRRFKCLSPSHNDNNPSMSYDRNQNRVHCFSCGCSYDLFDVIGIMEGLSTGAAMKRAEELYGDQKGAAVPMTEPEKPKADYTEFFLLSANRLKETDYLSRRGISEEIARSFRIGFDPAWKVPLAEYLSKGEGRSREAWERIPTSARVILPSSRRGYLARATDPENKYPKLKVGVTSLFGVGNARKANKPIFIVEGEIDALSFFEVGSAAIGLCSTANTDKLVQEMERDKPAQPLILALDNDKPGQEATRVLKEGLTRIGVSYLEADTSRLYSGHKDANEALTADREGFRSAVLEAETERTESTVEHWRADRILDRTLSHIMESDGVKPIPTGFAELDKVLEGGLFPGVCILGAISSLGKTAFALQIADQAAAAGYKVLVFSLEMSEETLVLRSISRLTATSKKPLTASQLFKFEWADTVDEAAREYQKFASRLFIREGSQSITQIRETVQQLSSFTGKPDLVVIDYLQYLTPEDARLSDKAAVDANMRGIVELSKTCNLPVLVVSSFNRASYGKRVEMQSFKESGSVEYSADVLIGLQLEGAGESSEFDETEAKRQLPRKVEAVLLKNRLGAVGDKVQFDYDPRYSQFKERAGFVPVTGRNPFA